MRKLYILFFLMFNFTYAFEKVAIGFAQGSSSTDIYVVAFEKEFDYKLIDSTNLSVELGFDYAKDNGDSLSIISLQPMINYDFNQSFYLQVGIGIAYFSQKSLDNRLFGTNIQFKESIGFGYRFSENLATSLKYVHYSNADMANENSGIDMGLVQLIYRF